MKSSITLTSGGKPLQADVYAPAVSAHGLIVVAYGSDGLTNDLSGPWKTMIEGYATSLAEKGLFVAIPDYLKATDTIPGQEVFDVMARLSSTWQAALSDATDQCIVHANVSPQRVGLLGFSLGGHLALRVRAKATALVEFFAPAFDGLGSATAHPAHAQIHHGTADTVPCTGYENAPAIEITLKNEGTATELFAYRGAGHGFVSASEPDRNARDLSKARTLSFFGAHL
jgi:dienelactone hydrolase